MQFVQWPLEPSLLVSQCKGLVWMFWRWFDCRCLTLKEVQSTNWLVHRWPYSLSVSHYSFHETLEERFKHRSLMFTIFHICICMRLRKLPKRPCEHSIVSRLRRRDLYQDRYNIGQEVEPYVHSLIHKFLGHRIRARSFSRLDDLSLSVQRR